MHKFILHSPTMYDPPVSLDHPPPLYLLLYNPTLASLRDVQCAMWNVQSTVCNVLGIAHISASLYTEMHQLHTKCRLHLTPPITALEGEEGSVTLRRQNCTCGKNSAEVKCLSATETFIFILSKMYCTPLKLIMQNAHCGTQDTVHSL